MIVKYDYSLFHVHMDNIYPPPVSHSPLINYIPSHPSPSFTPLLSPSHQHLKVSNRILTRVHPRSHIPILDQTRPDHPPDTGYIALAVRDAVASEVDRAEGCARQVGADEDALYVDGAAFELGGLEGDDNCGAVLLRVGVGVSCNVFFPSLFLQGGIEVMGENAARGVWKRRAKFRVVRRSLVTNGEMKQDYYSHQRLQEHG